MKDIYNATAGTAELRKKVLKYSAPIAAQTGKKKKKPSTYISFTLLCKISALAETTQV